MSYFPQILSAKNFFN